MQGAQRCGAGIKRERERGLGEGQGQGEERRLGLYSSYLRLLCLVGEVGHVGRGPVVLEVAPDQVTRGQGGHQAELPRQHSGADHSGQLGGILARVSWVRALDPEHLQARRLGGQDGAAPHGAHLDAGHGAGDVEVLAPLPPRLHLLQHRPTDQRRVGMRLPPEMLRTLHLRILATTRATTSVATLMII